MVNLLVSGVVLGVAVDCSGIVVVGFWKTTDVFEEEADGPQNIVLKGVADLLGDDLDRGLSGRSWFVGVLRHFDELASNRFSSL